MCLESCQNNYQTDMEMTITKYHQNLLKKELQDERICPTRYQDICIMLVKINRTVQCGNETIKITSHIAGYKIIRLGLPWWFSSGESACQCKGQEFWSLV